MSWLRRFDPISTYRATMRGMDKDKARKYVTFLRVAYFFCTSSLLMYVVHSVNEAEKVQKAVEELKSMEAGQPVIRDESEAYANLRTQGVDAGVLYKYSPEKGWHIEEFHRSEYLSRLQKKAFEESREAQKKALAEGRELPANAILLIDKPEPP